MDGTLAVVTGAGRGIGAAVSRQLAGAGFEVVVTARRLADAEATRDAITVEGLHARALQLDIADRASVEALAAALGTASLDLLVNNAAAFADWSETASAANLDRAVEVLRTNLFGTWGLTQALLPALRRRPGARIVNVGSGSGSHGDGTFGLGTSPAAASYAISKAALHALTVKLAVELAPEQIDVVAVDPGLTATAPGMEAMGARPVADGAASIVTAATSTAIPTGTFTRDGTPLPW